VGAWIDGLIDSKDVFGTTSSGSGSSCTLQCSNTVHKSRFLSPDKINVELGEAMICDFSGSNLGSFGYSVEPESEETWSNGA
jgi:hypothetical protein